MYKTFRYFKPSNKIQVSLLNLWQFFYNYGQEPLTSFPNIHTVQGKADCFLFHLRYSSNLPSPNMMAGPVLVIPAPSCCALCLCLIFCKHTDRGKGRHCCSEPSWRIGSAVMTWEASWTPSTWHRQRCTSARDGMLFPAKIKQKFMFWQ